MILVRKPLVLEAETGGKTVAVRVERRVLGKRLFRARADDETDFGFDLEKPLSHGDCVYEKVGRIYRIEQVPEPVLRVHFSSADEGARFGWMIGNLHFPAAIETGCLLVEDDSAVRQMLERNGIAYEAVEALFQPLSGTGHGHHHHENSEPGTPGFGVLRPHAH